MRETKFWAKLRPHFMDWGVADRIENSAGSGMSDVFYNIGGHTGWIETKIAKGSLLFFEKFQIPWMLKHTRQGGRFFVMALDRHETICVYRAADVVKAPRRPEGKWTVVDMTDLETILWMPRPYKLWDELHNILVSS